MNQATGMSPMSLFEGHIDRVAALEKVPFLQSLNPADLNRISLNLQDLEAERGRTLIEQGQAGSSLYIIVDGTVSVERDGRQIAVRGPGEFVGELSLLLGEPCNANVVTLDDCRFLVLERRPFDALLTSAPSLTKQLLRDLARRFSKLSP